ncbi:ATP-binding cassette domain-containing protein [Mycobacterium sp. NBC_00419]|uniref:ABC transporter ATP-binding protein n=1 Tax=Mycobacterium sp. NBC_00419 TaxID=2975989 RepID=UPI002E22D52B
MTPLLELNRVSVTYAAGSQPAVTDIDLRVDEGELVLLAGPSGCGKSTVMRVINGLVPHAYRAAVSGSVTLAGRDAKQLKIKDISESVGTLLQNPGRQVVGQTVLADLAFGLENRGRPASEIHDRIHRTAERLGITESLLAANSHELSGGQLQLVAFAGVLVMDPRLIIVDEPLANLDTEAADRVLRALRDYVDAGGSAIVIEHRLDHVVPIAPDNVVYLDRGTITYSGGLDGFLSSADPAAVKLPFDTLRARADILAAQPSPAPRAVTGSRLRYSNADIGYDTSTVVADANLDLLAGQRVAILGRNGAGKSTLLRAAVGLADVTAGSIELEQRPVQSYSAKELAALCGYLFQNPTQALFAGTVAEELAFGPRNLGVDPGEIEGIGLRALQAVGLVDEPDVMTRVPRTLSFGQQRRLALALALTLSPKCLILDEPTAGQDEASASHFLDSILELPGVDSVYCITHDVDLALWRCDRVIVVDGGKVIADGSSHDVLHDTSLWDTGSGDPGRAVLQETDFVRAARAATTGERCIPSPNDLARQLSAVP